MKKMATSFKRFCAPTAALSASDPAVVHCWPVPLPKTPEHSQASLGQYCGVIHPLSWLLLHTRFSSKFSKPGFNSTWTVSFQMIKLNLENSKEQEIKLPTAIGSSKKQESSRKNIYFFFIEYTKAFDCVSQNKLWKIPKEMRIPDHLTCLLRNLHAGKKTTVRPGHWTTEWFQIGKGVHQGCILSPSLFNLYAEHIMRNARLDEA